MFRPLLSIVATVYNTGPCLAEFCRRASVAAEACGFAPDEVEVVLVNDGCPAGGLDDALRQRQADKRVVVVDLSRNVGHHKAMMVGCQQARGGLVFLIDSDLEEAPEWLPSFYERLQREGCDVVYGVQERRRGGLFEQVSGELFYKIFNAVAGVAIPRNIVTARLMTRAYVDALTSHLDRTPFMAGLWAITGFDQRPHMVRKLALSPTSYTTRRKLAVLVNALISFSSRPLVWMALAGAAIAAVSFVCILWLVARKYLLGSVALDWTSIIASIWCVGGMIIFCLGVVSLYTARIFEEVKRRPYAVVRRVYAASDEVSCPLGECP